MMPGRREPSSPRACAHENLDAKLILGQISGFWAVLELASGCLGLSAGSLERVPMISGRLFRSSSQVGVGLPFLRTSLSTALALHD
eukprot:4392690-Pyramimonas_sp.AAC.1